jgi:hypothetical protein
MGLTLALRVLALTLVSLIASQSILLAYAERAVDPYEALYNWLKKNLVVVGLTPYRGVNYPTIGEYREPNVITQTESGETIQMNYREYLNKLMEGKINLQARVKPTLKDPEQEVSFKLNLDPVFLTWGAFFPPDKPSSTWSCYESLPCTNRFNYAVPSVYLRDPSYLYSYITLTNGSKLKLPKGENLILALALKDVDVGVLVSSALGGKRFQAPLSLRSIMSRAPVDDPYFGIFMVEWSVKGQSGNLYKVGRGLYKVLGPEMLQVFYVGSVDKRTFEVTGSGGASSERWAVDSSFFHSIHNVTIFKPIGPPLDSVKSLVNVNMAPSDVFLASSAMYVIKPEAYSGRDRVEVVVSDVRGKFRLALSFEIEVGGERFKVEGYYTKSHSEIKRGGEMTHVTNYMWSARLERIGYDEHGSLRLKVTINLVVTEHSSGSWREFDFGGGSLIDPPIDPETTYSKVVRELRTIEAEVAIGGYTLNPAPPNGVITIPQAVLEAVQDTLYSKHGTSTTTIAYAKTESWLSECHINVEVPLGCREYGYRSSVLYRTSGVVTSSVTSSGSQRVVAQVSILLYPGRDHLSLGLFIVRPPKDYWEGEFKVTRTVPVARYIGTPSTSLLGCTDVKCTWRVSIYTQAFIDVATYTQNKRVTDPSSIVGLTVSELFSFLGSGSIWFYTDSYLAKPPHPSGGADGLYIRKWPESYWTRTMLVSLWSKVEKEAPVDVGLLTLTVEAKEDLISGRKGLLEARLYGDKVEGVPVELEAKLTMLFTKEGKPYNKSLEIAVEPRQARTDGSGRALFTVTIPSIHELKEKLELSEEELKQTQILDIAFLKVRAKAGDLEAYRMILVTIAGVYAKINIWDIGIPIPQNLWGEEAVTEYIADKHRKGEGFIEKYFRPKDSDLRVEVYIESLDGKVKTTITETKLLRAGSGGELEAGKEYKVSYKMIYKGKVVLEAVNVAKFKLGNESEGLEVVDVNVYIPASLYLKYIELKQILEGTVQHNYVIPLGDPALVLTIIPIMPVVEAIARELGITITVDDWAYLKPKIKIPDWGEKGTELEVFNKITYADERFNLTVEALDNPKSYWSKMAKLTIIMAETIRTYRYTLSTTKALAVLTALLITLDTAKGLFSWQNKPKLIKETSIAIEKNLKKLPLGDILTLKSKDVKAVKKVKIGFLVGEGAIMTTVALFWPEIFKAIQPYLDGDALTMSVYIAALFKITRFSFGAPQGLADFIVDVAFEIVFQVIALIIAHTVNTVFNEIAQLIIDSETKGGKWASRDEAYGAIEATSKLEAAEKVFNDVAGFYLKTESILQMSLSIIRGVDGIIEIDPSVKLANIHKIPDWLAKYTQMPKEFKTGDVTSKLYISFVAMLAADTLVKIPWLAAFKAALVGDKKALLAKPGAVSDLMNIMAITLQALAPMITLLLVPRAKMGAKMENPSYSGERATISLSTPGDVDLDNLRASLGVIRDLKPEVIESLQLTTYNIEVLAKLMESIESASRTLIRLSHRTSDLNLRMAFADHYSTLQSLGSHLEDLLSAIMSVPSLRPTEEHVEAVGDLIDLITSTLESSINTTITAMKANALSNRVEEPVVFIEGVSTTPEGWIEVSIANVGDVGANVKLSVVESDVLSSYSSEVAVGARSVETVILKPQVKQATRIASVVLELVVNNVSNTYNVSLVFEPSVNLEVYGDKAVVYNGLVEFSDGKFRVSNLTFISILVNSSNGRFLLYLDGSPVRTGLIRFGNATLVSASFTKPITGVLEIKTVDSRIEVVRGSGVLETNLGVSIESDSPVEAKIEMLKDNPYPEAGLSGGGNTVVYSIDVRGDKPVKVTVNLDVLGVSDVSKVKIYKYSSTREAYVEIEDYTIDSKSRTITFTLKPGDPVIAITSKPITPGGEGAKIVYTTGNVRPPRSPEFQGGVGVEEAGRSLWFYVALVAIAVVAAFVALIALARFRRRS